MNERRVTYHINDHESLRMMYAGAEGLEGILESLPPPFICTYTLIGDSGNMYPDRYELRDEEGNKININSLNGYQKGVVLDNAKRHYSGMNDDMYGIMSYTETRDGREETFFVFPQDGGKEEP